MIEVMPDLKTVADILGCNYCLLEKERNLDTGKIAMICNENLDDKNEKTELKKIAIQKISGNKARLNAVLPQLKRLERMGPLVGIDGALRETLRSLIEETEKEIIAEQSN